MRLLDTNHASRIVQRDPDVLARLEALKDEEYAISVVVEGELLFMARNSSRRSENLASVQEFLETVRVLPIESETARQYAQLKACFIGSSDRANVPLGGARRSLTSDSGITMCGSPPLRSSTNSL